MTGAGGTVAAGADPEEARRRALEWLAPRLDDVPGRLAEAVRACVKRAGAEGDGPACPASVPEVLAAAAVDELERVSAGASDRGTAVRLLAADAVLTYAFEAAAETGGDVEALADEVGLRGRIGRRLDALLEGTEP